MPKGKSRRNIGKRKWRRHKHTNAVQEIFLNQAKEEFSKDPLLPVKKLKVGPVTSLFKIDTNPNTKSPLDKDRFKKGAPAPLAKLDMKKIDALIKKSHKNPEILNNEEEQKKPEVFDLWANPTPTATTRPKHKETKKNLKVPTVIIPHAGQSINPSMKAQKELMKLVVDQTELRRGKYGNKKVKIGNKKKQRMRFKNKKQEEHFKRMKASKDRKIHERDEKLAGKYLIDFRKEMKAKKLRLEERKKIRESIKEKIKQGVVLPTKRKIGKRRYKPRAQEFKELDEIDPKFKNVEANQEALREQFDGIYRRGLIEPMNQKKAKKRGNLPKYKFHSNPNLTWSEREKGIGKMGIVRGKNSGSGMVMM